MCYKVIMPSITLTVRTEKEVRDRLDQTAGALGRNRNWCMNEAFEQYLDLHQWQVEHIRKGMASGKTYSTEEVTEHFKKREEQRKSGK